MSDAVHMVAILPLGFLSASGVFTSELTAIKRAWCNSGYVDPVLSIGALSKSIWLFSIISPDQQQFAQARKMKYSNLWSALNSSIGQTFEFYRF